MLFRSVPRLVLARRSEEPHPVLSQAGIESPILATPVRNTTLLAIVRREIGT